jgi:hypothetical protein
VAMPADGTRVAVGAPFAGGESGQVRIHQLVGMVWTQEVGQAIDGVAADDR